MSRSNHPYASDAPYSAFGTDGRDDDYTPRRGNDKLQQAQRDVDEVVLVMRENMEKVMVRDEKLTELEDNAESLMESSNRFKRKAVKLKSRMWLENVKWKLCIAFVILLIIAIIVGVTVSKEHHARSQTPPSTPPP
eukprot:m.259690 g.259690  ORF g.259690 m.259690 type:complete len:136 (-) comp38518_c0_seq1:213-620(-)